MQRDQIHGALSGAFREIAHALGRALSDVCRAAADLLARAGLALGIMGGDCASTVTRG